MMNCIRKDSADRDIRPTNRVDSADTDIRPTKKRPGIWLIDARSEIYDDVK